MRPSPSPHVPDPSIDPLGATLGAQGWRRVAAGPPGGAVAGVWTDRAARCLLETRYGETGPRPVLHTLLADGAVVTTSVAAAERWLAVQEWSARYYLEIPERDVWGAITTHRARMMEVASARRTRPVSHDEPAVYRALVEHLDRVSQARSRFLHFTLLLGVAVGVPGLVSLLWMQLPLVRIYPFFGALALLGGPAAWVSVFGLTLAWLFGRMPDPGPMPRELLLAELTREVGEGPVSRRTAETERRAFWPGVLATVGSHGGLACLLIGGTLLAG